MSGNSERQPEQTEAFQIRCPRCACGRFVQWEYGARQNYLNLEDNSFEEGEWDNEDYSLWECYLCGLQPPERIQRALSELHTDLTR